MSSLVKKSLKLFGGSAVAGMGFSFGRDIYRGVTKGKNRNLFMILALLAGAFIGAFTGGVWLARNYPTVFESLWRRIVAAMMLLPCFSILLFIGFIFIPSSADPAQEGQAAQEQENVQAPKESFPYGAFVLPVVITMAGVIKGGAQRTQREMLWGIEEANEKFLESHALVENEDETFEDMKTGQAYRTEHIGHSRITLFPIGRRGKRAYIMLDEDGRFLEFSGLVNM